MPIAISQGQALSMKQHFYRDRDYAFGQIMLTLRSAMELTQAQLAEALNVSSRAVGDWEAGVSYPKVERLKEFIALAVGHQAFHTGHEVEEIRALWKAAHQKVLLDEMWLTDLLSHIKLNLTTPANEPIPDTSYEISSPARGRRVDWGDAITVRAFFGREWELARLTGWVLQERCRVVGLLGVGGIGKSALSVNLMHQVAPQFDVVIWRSLRDAPTCESLLDSCLQVLAPQPYRQALVDLEQRLNLLIEYLRGQRALVILDNLETLLEEGADTGYMRSGYEGYERLISRVGETEHQSCLLFTSREKPIHLAPLEGKQSFVRILRLTRLEPKPCEQLLAEKGVTGGDSERGRLIDIYAGNPLALKIVAQTIVDVFGGEIAPFLEHGEIIFGGIRALLAEQFGRLSHLEQCILLWLAIMREPTSLDELMAIIVMPVSRARLLEAIESLHRRSLIERGQLSGSFTLQSVVLEYATAQLIVDVGEEIRNGKPVRLLEHGFVLSHAHEYVRQTQERLIAAPIIALLNRIYGHQVEVEKHLLRLLAQFTSLAENVQGYGPANLVTLVRMLRGDLRGLDLSNLTLRGLYLQGVEMQDTYLRNTRIEDCVFTESFDAMWEVAISPSGEYWAASSLHGEIRVWGSGGQTLYRAWQAHDAYIPTLRFSPDGNMLASGSGDSTVKLWDVASGALLWSDRHTEVVNRVEFAPNGTLLASAGVDAYVRFWDVNSGLRVESVLHPAGVSVLVWSPDGRLLVTGDMEGTIRFWELSVSHPPTCVQTLKGHIGRVSGLVFSPDGDVLASAGWDGRVKLWEVANGLLLETLSRHTDRVNCVIWSPDGRTLASSSSDQTIWLWDVEEGNYRAVLQGHNTGVEGLAFTPDSRSLLSSSEDGTMRLWDVANGQCLRIIHGNVTTIWDLDWSPDGTQLICGGSDALVLLLDTTGATAPRVLHEHGKLIHGVDWSPDGRWVATGGRENMIRLWDPNSGECVEVLKYSDDPGNSFNQVAWSPDGERLAAAASRHGLKVFDLSERHPIWNHDPVPTRVWSVAWSPDGMRLAGGGIGADDATVYIWDAANGNLLQQMKGHHFFVSTVAWSMDGTQLASGGYGKDRGELFIWDVNSGERIQSFAGYSQNIHGLVWGLSDNELIAGYIDGRLCWWDVQSGERLRIQNAHHGAIRSIKKSPDGKKFATCGDDGAIMVWDLRSGEHLQTLRRDRPYERMDITGIWGLNDAHKATLRALGAVEARDGSTAHVVT